MSSRGVCSACAAAVSSLLRRRLLKADETPPPLLRPVSGKRCWQHRITTSSQHAVRKEFGRDSYLGEKEHNWQAQRLRGEMQRGLGDTGVMWVQRMLALHGYRAVCRQAIPRQRSRVDCWSGAGGQWEACGGGHATGEYVCTGGGGRAFGQRQYRGGGAAGARSTAGTEPAAAGVADMGSMAQAGRRGRRWMGAQRPPCAATSRNRGRGQPEKKTTTAKGTAAVRVLVRRAAKVYSCGAAFGEDGASTGEASRSEGGCRRRVCSEGGQEAAQKVDSTQPKACTAVSTAGRDGGGCAVEGSEDAPGCVPPNDPMRLKRTKPDKGHKRTLGALNGHQLSHAGALIPSCCALPACPPSLPPSKPPTHGVEVQDEGILFGLAKLHHHPLCRVAAAHQLREGRGGWGVGA